MLRIPVTTTIPDIPDAPSSEEVETYLDPSLTFTNGESHVKETNKWWYPHITLQIAG